MSGTVADRKRLLHITQGNLRNNHIYIAKHLDFFPSDILGASRKSKNNGHAKPIEIFLEGLDEIVTTDIRTSDESGNSRGFFRGRSWVRRFFERHKTRVGDVVALNALSEPNR